MADIRTQDDWWKSAKETLPLLPDYASSFGRNWDAEKAEKALADRNWMQLYRLFEKLWADLPDSPIIHIHPFGDLCDLCSESWVFTDNLSTEDEEKLEAYFSD
jgi:hypothetical protein